MLQADIQRLAELIDRLDSTPVQKRTEARRKNDIFGRAAIGRMFEDGSTFGEAAGTMPWLNGPDALERLRALKDDLGAQISMFNHILDNWFEHGEPVAPGYPSRIAVILRKSKLFDIEARFLRSYGRHFLAHNYGASSEKLNERIRKVLVADEADQMLSALSGTDA